MSGLSKRFGGVHALNNVSLEVERGTIHAVVGENGAGKSTLMKILAGSVQPDSGQVLVNGEELRFGSPVASKKAGIGIVYQELSLFLHRPVLANLFVNSEPERYGLIRRREMVNQARPVLERLGLDIDLRSPVSNLSIGERQLVEISRVLIQGPNLLILDEPNSALNERETGRVFEILRQLRADGHTILFISHRLEEVFRICDRITVMRNGEVMFTRDRADLTIAEVVEGMLGESPTEIFPPARAGIPAGSSRLAVERLTVGEKLKEVSFSVSSGEIVGLAGLEGSGVKTLLGVLFGTQKATSGSVVFPDGGGLPRNVTMAARRGLSLVPSDRRNQGLMLDKSLVWNVSQVRLGALVRDRMVIRWSGYEAATRRQIDHLHIKASSPNNTANQLSGGNQQKVVLAKWLDVDPKVVLLDDPTRGVDVGAKREIYALIRKLSDEGRVVLFYSTEMPELIGLCDRILIFFRGWLLGEVSRADANEERVLEVVNTGQFHVLNHNGST